MKWLTVVVVSIGRFFNLMKGYRLKTTQMKMSSTEFYRIINEAFPRATVELKDSEYTYTNLNEWLSVIVLVLSNLPRYRKHQYDCENYALSAMVLTSELCGLNTMLYVRGTSASGGAHGFNAFLCEKGLYILEPQCGIINPSKYKVTGIKDFGKVNPMILENAEQIVGA